MNKVVLLTHFSIPRWPLVNKLSGISKCLGVEMIHCPTLEKLKDTLRTLSESRALLLMDEGMVEFVGWIHQEKWAYQLDLALFIQSKISKVAVELTKFSRVKYLLEFDETDSFGGRHLAVLVKKFTEQNILSLDKYLGFGAVIHSQKINSNSSRRDAIEKVHFYVENLGDDAYAHPFGEYARRISEMADELVLNSIFNANPRMAGVDRSLDFNLDETEQVELSWGFDGECFGVCVRDPFGQFNLETIMKYISTQAKMDDIVSAQSAGLGLKLILDRAHQLIANVQKKKVTEVIAIVKFENRLLDFEKTRKSFFYFTDGLD